MTKQQPREGDTALEWYVVTGGREAGPYTADELLQRGQVGRLLPDHVLREAHDNTTCTASSLSFLEVVWKQDELPQKPPISDILEGSLNSGGLKPEPQSKDLAPGHLIGSRRHPAEPNRHLSIRFRKLIMGTCGVASAVILGGWCSWSPTQSVGASTSDRVTVRKSVARPPRPQPPTLSNVPRDHRVPLPGFEFIESTFAPTLSADLKTIVFSGPHPQSGYDLFMATRNDVNQPFNPPEHIRACTSEETDAYASLSADGLELIFIRSDKHPRLWYTVRNTTEEPFAAPEPLAMGDFDAEQTDVYLPHMPTELDVVFMVHSNSESGWDIVQASRETRDSPFQTPRPVPFSDATPPYRLSSDMLRAYFGWPKGIWMSARGSADELFDPSHSELSSVITGEIDGPIFVSPKEDIFIFCGPETGKPFGESRKLWMVQP